jgi:hypothetical protein
MTIIDLTNSTALRVSSSALPVAGTLEADIQIGKAIFNTGTGVNLPSLGPDGVIGLKLSNAGWSGCFGCHAFGLTDGVTWVFGTGPRRSLPMNGIFNPHDPNDQKILNYSDVNDEVQDFENNIRDISGGEGLITGAVNAQLGDPNAGRSSALDKARDVCQAWRQNSDISHSAMSVSSAANTMSWPLDAAFRPGRLR